MFGYGRMKKALAPVLSAIGCAKMKQLLQKTYPCRK